jgi:hypothetical protein
MDQLESKMAKKKKLDDQVLNEFFDEVETQKKSKINSDKDSNEIKNSPGVPKPYQCPSCHKSLSSRKEPCKYCGYKGYIPMGDDEIKRTRVVIFIILFVIAVAVYVLTRQ